MKKVSLSGSVRKNVGKKDAKLIRREGLVPAVLYGNKEQTHFALKEVDIKKLVFTPNVYIVELDIDGKKADGIIKEVQMHPVTDRILHIDFYRLFPDKEVTVAVPVETEGVAPGIIKGGTMSKVLKKLKVRAIPANLPDAVVVDISKLDIGDKVYVSELRNDKYKILHPDNVVVVQVKMSRAAMKAKQDALKAAKEA